MIHCQDIRDVKAKLDEVSETLNTLAVQEQKIVTVMATILEIRKEQAEINSRLTKLQSDHDRCQIGSVVTNIDWLKWFVMGNTMTQLGLVFGFVYKLMHP